MKAVESEVHALEAERMSTNGDHYSQIAILITTTLSMERGLFYFCCQHKFVLQRRCKDEID